MLAHQQQGLLQQALGIERPRLRRQRRQRILQPTLGVQALPIGPKGLQGFQLRRRSLRQALGRLPRQLRLGLKQRQQGAQWPLWLDKVCGLLGQSLRERRDQGLSLLPMGGQLGTQHRLQRPTAAVRMLGQGLKLQPAGQRQRPQRGLVGPRARHTGFRLRQAHCCVPEACGSTADAAAAPIGLACGRGAALISTRRLRARPAAS